MFVYSEEQGRVVQHRTRGAGVQTGSRWTSLESVDFGSVHTVSSVLGT